MAGTWVGCDRYSVAAYFELLRRGILREDDRVELLDGVIVSEPPCDPPHAAGVEQVAGTLRAAVGDRAAVRTQAPLVAAPDSVPEPDVAVVPGANADYWSRHPTHAWLVVEIANSTLQQDRLSKSRIYAGAGIPEYWIVNLRDHCVEVYRSPDPPRRLYAEQEVAGRGVRLSLAEIPEATVAVADLLPPEEFP